MWNKLIFYPLIIFFCKAVFFVLYAVDFIVFLYFQIKQHNEFQITENIISNINGCF